MAIRIRRETAPQFFLLMSIIVIVLLLVLLLPLELAEKKRVEGPYSTDMEYNDKAYIDITYCEPKYAISEKGKPGKGIQDIICEVETTDKGTMLVAIAHYYYIQGTRNFEGSKEVDSVQYFGGNFGPENYAVLSFDTPFRLHCRVSDTENYDLLGEEGERVVLEMRYNNEGD